MKWRNGKAYNDDGSEMTAQQLDLYVKRSQQYINELINKSSDKITEENIISKLSTKFKVN